MALLSLVMTVQAVPGCPPIVELHIDGLPQARLDMRWLAAEELGRLYHAEYALQLGFADDKIHRLEMCCVRGERLEEAARRDSKPVSQGDRATLTHEILFYARRFRR